MPPLPEECLSVPMPVPTDLTLALDGSARALGSRPSRALPLFPRVSCPTQSGKLPLRLAKDAGSGRLPSFSDCSVWKGLHFCYRAEDMKMKYTKPGSFGVGKVRPSRDRNLILEVLNSSHPRYAFWGNLFSYSLDVFSRKSSWGRNGGGVKIEEIEARQLRFPSFETHLLSLFASPSPRMKLDFGIAQKTW